MRNVPSQDAPSLFPTEILSDGAITVDVPVPENTAGVTARDFIRWCWSFDGNFRNSPDITNFRFWLRKCSLSVSSGEEQLILDEARRLYLKKVEQAVRKSELKPIPE